MGACSTSTTMTRSMPRLLSALTSTDNNRKAISNASATVTTDEESIADRRRCRKSSKLAMIEALPAALSNKKKEVLLDAFGQPRKSPREHASTLAILSGLVQQRRNRFKEMNGGISPEKMSSFCQLNGLTDMTDDDADGDADDCDNDNETENGDNFDQDSQCSDSNSKPEKPTSAVIKVESSEAEGASVEVSERKFLPRKGMRRQASSAAIDDGSKVSKPIKSSTAAAAVDEDGEEDDSSQKDIKFPKMPVDTYIDPNVVAKQLDDLLNACYANADDELNEFSAPFNDNSDNADLILVNTPKDFVEIVSSVKEGPLTYRSLVNANKKAGLSSFGQKGKKRRNNKTGWPSLPKRRNLFKREKTDGSGTDNGAVSNTEDDENGSVSGTPADGEVDRIDISSHLLQNKADEFFIQSRRHRSPLTNIKTENDSMDDEKEGYEEYEEDEEVAEPFMNDNDNAINHVFTSSSEKAENSDIFTVSSDSLDTTDLTTAEVNGDAAAAKRKIAAPGPPDVEDEESAAETDESSSDATTIAEIIQKKVALKATDHPIIDDPQQQQRKIETRAKGERNILAKQNNRLTLQPVVCVKKMNEKDFYRRAYNSSASTSPQKTKESPAKQVTAASISNRNSCSPKTKVSPRKLRKPRGRWYRER